MPLSHFDERSGIVSCETDWGKWWQTVSEVFIEIETEKEVKAKQIKIEIKPNFISCQVSGKEMFKGKLYRIIKPEESTWTLEERKHISILLVKADPPNIEQIWESLLIGQYAPNPWVFNEMRKKIDLERFQIENPGFDFSSAKLSKSYDKVPEEDDTTEKNET